MLALSPALRREIDEEFDEAFYLSENPDVFEAGFLAKWHYVRFGRKEGRAPSPLKKSRAPGLVEQSQPIDQPLELKPAGCDCLAHQYAAIAPIFDSKYYLTRYPDLIGSGMTPLEHFILHGGPEGRKPVPWFDTQTYRKRYSDAEKVGNPLLHYVLVGRDKGYDPGPYGADEREVSTISRALGLRPGELLQRHREYAIGIFDRAKRGELGRMFDRAAEIDPLVAHAKLSLFECGIQPLREKHQVQYLSAIIELQEAARYRPAKAVVLIPWNHLGGATKLAGHLTQALVEILGLDEVLVVQTETGEWDYPQWFPDDVRRVDFSKPTRSLSERNRVRVLFEYLRSLQPDVIINVNSPIFWEMMEAHGSQLADDARLFTYFFCNERHKSGQWSGYPIRYFHRFQDILEGVLVDSHALKEQLTARFLLHGSLSETIHVLDTPIADSLPLMPPPQERGRDTSVGFWAGRFDRQKRVDIVYEIARRLPHVTFRMWGESKLDKSAECLEAPENVHREGAYRSLAEVDLRDADFWLYTSEWDGVPNVLIEVATTGIPLVGSLSGGTGEILDQGYSFPVASVEDVGGFVAAINAILADPSRARANARALREVVLATRDPQRYRRSVARALRLESCDA